MAPRRRTAPRIVPPDELEFQDAFMLGIGARRGLRLWRQNTGSVPVRDHAGKVIRYFHAGPPVGAADLSGILSEPSTVAGLRLEIEMKSAMGTRSPEQVRWAEFIQASGGVYVLLAYDASLSLKQNVHVAIASVDAAIEARVAR